MIETNRVEYKSKLIDNFEKEISAFLNYKEGGVVYIGIDSSGNVVGYENADETQLKVKDRLKHNISPVFEIFSDRIEITSTGGLSTIKNLEDFFSGYSKPISREIMRIYKDLELVEHLGSGLNRILKAYSKDSFVVKENFMRNIFYSNVDEIQQDGGVNELFYFIQNNPNLRTKEISNTLNIPLRTIERYIKQLKDEEKIEFKGSPKTGGYIVI